MQKAVVDQLIQFVEEGAKSDSPREIKIWSFKVGAFLETALGPDQKDHFFTLGELSDDWATLALRLGHLQGLLAGGEADPEVWAAAGLVDTTLR